MKTHDTPVRATYTTDCFRRIQDAETGEVRVTRWAETRAVSVTLTSNEGAVFFRGARIA